MKISDVCRQYGFDENDLKAFLKEKKLLKETWTSYVIEDSNVDKAVRMYAEFKAQQEEEAVFIAEIPLDDWRIVVRHRLEAVILDVCLNGRQAVYAIIEAYRTKAPPNKRHCDEKG
mgnify:CR=1 FL=1